ncbi:MAG: hypothetical protein E7464_07335 [Ruminococcaceae bacterium]|nr:hypothetical protein [Oscillospiraceae bacterium]
MRDYVPEEEFTLEDILREFGSGPDTPPPEPVLPGMPEAFPTLPEIPELPPDACSEELNREEETQEEPAEAPKEPKRRKPKRVRKEKKPLAEVSDDPYVDDFEALEGDEADYAFSMSPGKAEKKQRQPRMEQIPEVPEKVRSAESILRDVETREKSMDLRLRICLVVTVVNLLLAIYHGIGLHWIHGFENVAALGVISLLLLLCAVGVAYDVIYKGLRQLGGSHYGSEAFLPILSVAGVVEAVFAIIAGRLPFCALVSMNLLCALWAQQRQAEALRSAALVLQGTALHGVRRIDGAWQGHSAAARGEADTEYFEAMLESDGPQKKVLRVYVPIAIVLSLLLAGLAALLGQLNFFWIWTALLLVASPISCFLCFALPNGLLVDRLARKKAALCGWYGAQVLNRCEALFLRNGELFPEGSLKLSGIKVFGSYQSGQVMSYAAAVLQGTGCDAASVLTSAGEPLPLIGALRAFDEGGYSGEIGTDTVLVGTLSFLKRMGVHLESGARVRQALYVAINGELAGLIALRYEASTGVQRALKSLSGRSAPAPVISGGDVLITPAMLRAKFRLPLDRLICPPLRERLRCAGITACGEDLQGAVVAKGGLEPISAVCMGAKALVTAVHTALVLSVLAGIVGMIVIFLLATTDGMALVTCARLLGFALIWGAAFLIAAMSVLKK